MKVLYLFLLFIFYSCTQNANPKNAKTQHLASPAPRDTLQAKPPLQPYKNFLQQLKKEKAAIKNIDSARLKLYDCISQQMPAYWRGTGWDFNGTTRIPQQGNIACGYFVTTLLQDAGFPINRTKLAQQVSSVMIKQLTKNIASFSSITNLKNYISNQNDYSIFIVGLDFHTGFIIKDKSNSYFFHSNYIGRQGVVMEPLENSLALKSSKSFMVGSLSANEVLLKNWLRN